MQIVPVIDLRQNLVVHAIAGDRKNYKPIDSEIFSSPNPIDVINGYLKILNFKSIYIADLDALEQLGDNTEIINSICDQYPNIEIWLDCGISLAKNYLQKNIYANLRLILSSESISTISTFTNLLNQYSQHAFILSLDFKSNKLLGTNDIFNCRDHWPKDVIVLLCQSSFPLRKSVTLHFLANKILTMKFLPGEKFPFGWESLI